jgi:hypothetical protein
MLTHRIFCLPGQDQGLSGTTGTGILSRGCRGFCKTSETCSGDSIESKNGPLLWVHYPIKFDCATIGFHISPTDNDIWLAFWPKAQMPWESHGCLALSPQPNTSASQHYCNANNLSDDALIHLKTQDGGPFAALVQLMTCVATVTFNTNEAQEGRFRTDK